MFIKDLDRSNYIPNVVIVQTPSPKLSMFIEDKIKRMLGSNRESTITINSKSDLKQLKSVMGVSPQFAKRWYVPINLDISNNKDLTDIIKSSGTCTFFCTCSKYVTFKSFKEGINGVQDIAEFYINYLKRPDFLYIYDAIVPKDKQLSKQLFDFVIQGYSGDIESLFTLFLELNGGRQFNTRKDISDLCGLGGLTIDSFIFSLLKPLSGSDKGLKKVLNNRVRAGTELADSMGYSKLYNFTAKTVFALIEIKTLIISGDIYKSIRNLPDCYDERYLSRFQKYIWRLKEIPLSNLVLIRQAMGDKVWRNELDFFNFIYKYYKIKAINEHLGGAYGI